MIGAKIETALRAIVGDRAVLVKPNDLVAYECDGYTVRKVRPDAVVFPASTDEVAAIVRCLSVNGIAYVARGAGTGLSGGATAAPGEVVISLARMNKMLQVDFRNRYAIVQPGLVNRRLSQLVAADGYYFAPDPSSQQACTIGGNVGENAGGPHCLKYGVTTNHVLALEWVQPDGEVVIVGGPNGDSAGYDLRGLLIGSEGTLGIVTRIWVRLLRRPPALRTVLALFEDTGSASRAVSAIIAAGMVPAALEMMDRLAMRAVEAGVYRVGYPEDIGAVLLIELDGSLDAISTQAEAVAAICKQQSVRAVRIAGSEAERTLWWNNRKTAFGAMGNLSPDYLVQDGVIPRSLLPEVLDRIDHLGRRYDLQIANVFHAGDGNLHPLIVFDAKAGQTARAVELGSEVLQVCADVGGSISGEHGIGLEKMNDMTKVFNERDLAFQTALRDALNPDRLCNPGKLFPTPSQCIDRLPWSHLAGQLRAGETPQI